MDDEDPQPKPEPALSNCCILGERLIALRFCFDVVMEFEKAKLQTKEAVYAWLQEHPPEWFVVCRYGGINQTHKFDLLEGEINPKASFPFPIKFCPFCGQPVPLIEWNPSPPEPIELPIEAGYCSTCNKRHMACVCWPLVHLWRVKQ